MKRKLSVEDMNTKMMKMSRIELNESLPQNINFSLGRNFGYELSNKKAKTNLLKGAEREPFVIDEKQKCSMLLFSVGAYLQAIMPTVSEWNNGVKDLKNEYLEIRIEEVLPGYDDHGKHVDTLVTFKVDGSKIIATCYNTTQKIKVEGSGYRNFVEKHLKPFFCDLLCKVGTKKIDEYNNAVISSLSNKRKPISRPKCKI